MQCFLAPVNMNSMVMVMIMLLGLFCLGNATSVTGISDNALVMPVNFNESMQAFIDQLVQAMTDLHNKTGPGVTNVTGLNPHVPHHSGPPQPGPNSTHPHNNATHLHNVTDDEANAMELKSTLFLAYNVLESLKEITSGENKPTIYSANNLSSRDETSDTLPTDSTDSVVAVNVDGEAAPTTLSTVKAKPSAEIKAVGSTNQEHRYAFNCRYNRLYSNWCMQEQGWYCTMNGRKARKAGWGGPVGDPCETNCECTLVADVSFTTCPLTYDLGIICV